VDIGAARPPVFPVKGEAVALWAGDDNLRLVVRAPGAYLCPKADGRLVVGATEIAGETSLDPSPAAIDGLKQAGAAAFPASAGFLEAERWAGLRPATPDAAPILGLVPAGPDGLFFALGHYRNGVLLAPETAAALAPLILRGEHCAGLAAFSAARFPLTS
ncbi:MAG TPA: FAD-dependent oxidoreductase, partial [Parvularculaceae bacterium]|nr:FAD-dependent oxidoreductase [Parvularculaceae bacterium]